MIIGIDLGTTNSLVAVWADGKSTIIPNSLGLNLTPSAVGINDKGDILIGQAAKERQSTHPDSTAVNFKRFMGTDRQIRLGSRSYRPEELSSLVLRSLKADAEAFLGEEVSEAVITVPAYFSDAQRKATKIAGQLAGLKVERLLNEPTAAALAYGLHTAERESKYLVFDLGGGTFDVSILELFEGMMEVHASTGDNQLGGTDFTQFLVDYFIKNKLADLGVAADSVPPELIQRLQIKAEKVKREIGDRGKAEFSVNWQDKTASLEINESEFEKLVAPLLERLSRPIKGALRDARVRVEEISEIVFVGGATRMPCIRKLATRLFQRFPATGINPDEVVVHGAAVQAGLKARDSALNETVLTDVCPYTLGIEVSLGDSGKATPGYFQPIIERNNYIPVSRVERFYTLSDKQKYVNVRIYQGENPLVKDNIFLGELKVQVPLAEAGAESIDVRFTYDINGLLEVVVTVISTGESYSTVIEENPGVLSAEEIKKRLKNLDALKIHPRDLQENIVVMHRAERLYSELLGEDRDRLQRIIAQFISILDRQDPREIDNARKDFVTVLDGIEGAYRF